MRKLNKLFIVFFIGISFFGTSIQPISASMGESFNKDGFKYSVLSENGSTGTVEINGYVNIPTTPTDLYINRTITHNGITYINTSIGADAFYNNQLTNIIIPDSVTSIGADAFGNNQLTNIIIPDSVTSIGAGAFAENQLTEIRIPKNVFFLGIGVFFRNPLSAIYLASKDMLPILTGDSLIEAGTHEKPIEIYAPEVIIEYKDDSSIIKEVGELFQIETVVNVVYKQIERYYYYLDEVRDKCFLGADENAETRTYDIEGTETYQWYKDGIEIIGATNSIYSEIAQIPGIYQYYVTVNDVILDKIQVTITAKETENKEIEDIPDKEILDPKDKNKEIETGGKTSISQSIKNTPIPTGDNSNVSLLLWLFIGGGTTLLMTIKKKNNLL